MIPVRVYTASIARRDRQKHASSFTDDICNELLQKRNRESPLMFATLGYQPRLLVGYQSNFNSDIFRMRNFPNALMPVATNNNSAVIFGY